MSYWDILAEAETLLDAGEFAAAEERFRQARQSRADSPGRVFMSETLADKAREMLRRIRGAERRTEPGRWEAAAERFTDRFLARGGECLEQARSAAVAARDGSPVLYASAIHLAARSDIFPAVPEALPALVRAAMRAALAICEAPPPGLIDGDLPLDEADRVEAARLGAALVERLPRDDPDGFALAGALLALLSPTRFSLHSPLEEERSWWEAVLNDRGLGDGERAAGLYRHFLAAGPGSEHRDAARVRLVEILANVDRMHLPVPRYAEARGVAVAERPDDASLGARLDAALAVIDSRRPDAPGPAWATCAVDDGRWTCVVWNGDRAVDAAVWREGRDPEAIREFLASCRGRIVAAGDRPAGDPLAGFAVRPLAEALLEPVIPDRGLDDAAAAELSGPLSGALAGGSHPLLAGESLDAVLAEALRAGLLWLRCLERVERADPALGRGIAHLAGRGDTASRAVFAFIGAGSGPEDSLPELPPLAGRPAPFPNRRGPGPDALPESEAGKVAGLPAVLAAGGDPGGIAAAWAAPGGDLKVVLDSTSRLAELAGFIAEREGMTTLLPGAGPHDSLRAGDLLRDLVEAAAANPEDSDPLPLLHWCRMVETHNGDLADFALLRRRTAGAGTLYARYLQAVSGLPPAAEGDPWRDELAARAGMSATVVGRAEHLVGGAAELARLWGISAGEKPGWVFCDSAAVHWLLRRRDPGLPERLHRILCELGGSHLSLVAAGDFLPAQLEELLGGWLAPLAELRRRDFPPRRRSVLRLAVAGADPDSAVAAGEHACQALERFAAAAKDGEACMLIPRQGFLRTFLEAQARDDLASGGPGRPRFLPDGDIWSDAGEKLRGRVLLVPRLESPDTAAGFAPPGADAAGWRLSDCDRAVALAEAHRHLALEVNALLALGASTVEIVDTRWARRRPAEAPDTAEILRDAAAEGFDLPGAADPGEGGRRRKLRSPRGSLARACLDWMRGSGMLNDNDEGPPPGFASAAESVSDAPLAAGELTLAIGDREAKWRGLARHVALSRERGDRSAWLLCVTAEPPAEAGALLASSPDSGASAPPGRPGRSPVFWVRPQDLADAGLREAIQADPPAAVFAADLRDWLPPRGDDSAGAALRFIVSGLQAPAVVAATNLPPAWATFCRSLWREAAASGRTTAITGRAQAAPAAARVTVGRIGHPVVRCPRCSARVEMRRVTVCCPECGLAVAGWLPPSARAALQRELVGMKVRALIGRTDLGAEVPLGVWVGAERMDVLLAELAAAEVPFRREGGRVLAEPGGGRLWEISVLTPSAVPRPGLKHALLDLPEEEADLQTFRGFAGGEVGLWFHPIELAEIAPPGTGIAGLRDRYARLLDGMRTPPGLDPSLCWRGLMPARLVAMLTGLRPGHVSRCLGVASWLAAAAGREDGDRGDAIPERRLEPLMSFTELDYAAAGARRSLRGLLPRLLSGLGSGMTGRVDLAELRGESAEADLAFCDRFLLASSLRLGAADADGEGAGGPQLHYAAEDGVLFSARRVVGRLGSAEAVAEAAMARLDAFAAGAREAYAAAVPGSDFLPLPPDRDLVAVGIMLGCWRLAGVRERREIPMPVDPARGKPSRGEGACRPDVVLADLAASHREWSRRLDAAWSTGFLEESPAEIERNEAYSGRRHGGRRPAALAGFPGEPGAGMSAVRGPAGSGRLDLVVSSLARAVADGLPVGAVTVYCPDEGEAARFNLLWRMQAVGTAPPRIFCGAEASPGQAPEPEGRLPHDHAAEVCVMLEAQDIPAQQRYAIAQRHRPGRLIATVEPVLAREAWEHLFLTTPPPESVVDLKTQRDQSRRIWEERRGLAEMAGVESLGKTSRRDRGVVESHWATNLNECVSFLDAESRPGRAGVEVALVAPVADDLAYIGRAAAAKGWLSVFARERDTLLLPGNLEFVAAVGDAARGAGPGDSLLAPLLPPAERREYGHWLREGPSDPDTVIAGLYELCAVSDWGRGFLLDPTARARVQALVAETGDETVAEFVSRPLWEAWRRRAEPLAGARDAGPGAPLLTLGTADDGRSLPAPALIYLCLGAEPPRRHYRVLSRATDRAVVLYQERSPLPGDASDA